MTCGPSCPVACGILVPSPPLEGGLLINCWTAREVPVIGVFFCFVFLNSQYVWKILHIHRILIFFPIAISVTFQQNSKVYFIESSYIYQ